METNSYCPTNISHYWIIETPEGPTSTGTCKYCGETKTFKNTLYSKEWTTPGSYYPSMDSKVAKSIATRFIKNHLGGARIE